MEISLKLRTRTLDFSDEFHNSGSFDFRKNSFQSKERFSQRHAANG